MKADTTHCTSHFNSTEPGEEFLFSGSVLKAVPFSAELRVGCSAVPRSRAEGVLLEAADAGRWEQSTANDPRGESHGESSAHAPVTRSSPSSQGLRHPAGGIEIIPVFSNAEQEALPDI